MQAEKWLPSGREAWHVMKCAVSEWIDHRGASKGAALAFYTLFSMAPVLVLVIAIAGLFYGADAAQGRLMDELGGLMGKQSAQAIQAVLASARNTGSGAIATIIATVLLLVGATSVFSELKDSLDEIWELPAPENSGLWYTIRTRLLSFGLILVLGFLLMVSLVISAALAVLEHYFSGMWQTATVVLGWVASLISFLVIATLFGVIYKLLPRITLSWHDVIVGALGTAAMFTLGKFLIGLYIGNSGVASAFGAAGSLIAMLLWVYYSAQIFFLGAEFARQYALQMGSWRGKAPQGNKPASKGDVKDGDKPIRFR
jgi:membrane protein